MFRVEITNCLILNKFSLLFYSNFNMIMIDWSLICLLESGRGVVLEPENGQPFVLNKSVIIFLKQLDLHNQSIESACHNLQKMYKKDINTIIKEMRTCIDVLKQYNVVKEKPS